MHRFNTRIALAAVLALAVGPGLARTVSAADPVSEALQTIATFKTADPGIGAFFMHSAGYAVFPTVTKGAVGIGGAHGTGVLFVGGKPVGKAALSQVSVGAQIGGQEYSEVIFFQTPRAVQEFKQGNTHFSAQASAVALKSGAAANAKYNNEIAVFTATKGGLMAEAAIGGQKFSFEPYPTVH